MKNTIFLLLLLFSVASIAQKNTIDWNTDLEFIKAELPKNHFDFYRVKSEQDFMKGINQIAAQQQQLSDFETAVKLEQCCRMNLLREGN